jgi:hypothetical protein
MDIPLPFGLVRGRLYAGVGDTSDVGRAPDLLGLSGTATFTGTIVKRIVTTPGAEMIIVPQAIVASVEDGVLTWQSEPDVPLTANLAPDGTNLGWQWKVSFSLVQPNSTIPVVLPGWTLDVKVYDDSNPDSITLLVDSAPLDTPSPGVIITKGDKGDNGDAAVSYQLALSNGTLDLSGYTVSTLIRLSVNRNFNSIPLPTPAADEAYTITIICKQDSTGGRTITWPATIAWPSGLKPLLSTAPNATDVIHIMWTGAQWLGFVGGLAFA